MSHILDGLQRSESERSGSDSSAPKDPTELLRQIERRAASMWQASALVEPSSLATDAPSDTPFVRREGSRSATAAEAPSISEPLETDESGDVFNQFQPLQISVAPQNRLICVTDNESPAAEAFRLLGVRLRDLRRRGRSEEC